jgi:phage shock protein E
MDVLLAVAVAAVVAFVVFRLRRPSVDLETVQQALNDGAVLIDVRSPGEFASDHLGGARNVPVELVRTQAESLAADGRTVIVYCASGMRSASAARSLRAAGLTVHDLGGIGNGRGLTVPPASAPKPKQAKKLKKPKGKRG